MTGPDEYPGVGELLAERTTRMHAACAQVLRTAEMGRLVDDEYRLQWARDFVAMNPPAGGAL